MQIFYVSVYSLSLKATRVRGGGRHDDGVANSFGLLQRADQLGDGGALLAHAHVDAHELGLLVDDGVDRDASLGITITTRSPCSDISPSHYSRLSEWN